jgi:hypothetical protein
METPNVDEIVKLTDQRAGRRKRCVENHDGEY